MRSSKRVSFFFVFIGNILEHHDKALFSLLLPFIAHHFFKSSDPTVVLIQAYSTLFLGLLLRPIGAFMFGYLADRFGRLKTLSITILGMSFATFCIGCLPYYEKIGILSPILLTVFRGMQNFFAAGETNTAAIYTIENTERKSLMDSIFEASTIIGILLATGELFLLSYFDLIDKWPYLFLTAGILGIVCFYMRRGYYEQEVPKKSDYSIKGLFPYLKTLAAITFAAGFSCATYVMSITFFNSYLTLVSNLSVVDLAHITLSLLALDACLLPLFGWLAIKYSLERIMFFSVLCMFVLGFPLFLLLETGDTVHILFVRIVIVSIGACFAACFRTWAHSLVEKKMRCTILSIASSIAHLLVEGPLVLFSLWSFQQTKWIAWPGIYLSLFSLFTIGALFLVKSYPFKEPKITYSTN